MKETYFIPNGESIYASQTLVDVSLWAGWEDTSLDDADLCDVQIVFFDPNETLRCKVRLEDWLQAAFEDSRGAGPEAESCALVKIRDLCDRLIAARNAERTEIANTVANTGAIETEKPKKDG